MYIKIRYIQTLIQNVNIRHNIFSNILAQWWMHCLRKNRHPPLFWTDPSLHLPRPSSAIVWHSYSAWNKPRRNKIMRNNLVSFQVIFSRSQQWWMKCWGWNSETRYLFIEYQLSDQVRGMLKKYPTFCFSWKPVAAEWQEWNQVR